LDENSSIKPSEARDRLQKDTGLKLHSNTVNKYLSLLKQEMDSEWEKLVKFKSNIIEEYTKIIYPNGLSNTYIEYLKNILKEDKFITLAEARNIIQEETGLNLDIQGIWKNLIRMKKEMGLKCAKRRKLDSIFDIRKRHEGLAKIKCYHLEHLYKYLKENITIDPVEDKKKASKRYRFKC
jgi:hypothetical protein